MKLTIPVTIPEYIEFTYGNLIHTLEWIISYSQEIFIHTHIFVIVYVIARVGAVPTDHLNDCSRITID